MTAQKGTEKTAHKTGGERLKIAYLCDQDPTNPHTYSGGNTRLFNTLQEHIGDVHILNRGWHWAEPIRYLVKRMPVAINMRAQWRLHLALAPIIARGVQKELEKGRYDVIFCAYSFHSLYKLRPPKGVLMVYTSDATPTAYKNSVIGKNFGSFWSISRRLDPLILKAETDVFRKSDLLLWPSHWLKGEAGRIYGLADDRSLHVSWGANIIAPEVEETPLVLAKDKPIELLMIGRNWYAKGGHISFEVMKVLRDKGLDARLTVIGCTPPDECRSTHMTVHPNLDKSIPEQLATFTAALKSAHFFIMPSFESFGFAFCEASAYGLPSFCYRIGGVPVRDGINGHAFAMGTEAGDFANKMLDYMDHPEDYAKLRRKSRKEFEDHLNWQVWGQKVLGLIRSRIDELEAMEG